MVFANVAFKLFLSSSNICLLKIILISATVVCSPRTCCRLGWAQEESFRDQALWKACWSFSSRGQHISSWKSCPSACPSKDKKDVSLDHSKDSAKPYHLAPSFNKDSHPFKKFWGGGALHVSSRGRPWLSLEGMIRGQGGTVDCECVSVQLPQYTFCHSPPATLLLREFSSYPPGSSWARAIQEEVNQLLLKGTVELVDNQVPAFYSCLFLIEKTTGVLEANDLFFASQMVRPPQKFRMELYTVFSQEGRLHVLSGLEGWLFPDSWSSGVSPIPLLYDRLEVLPIQGPVFQPFNSSSGVYLCVHPSIEVDTSAGHATPSLCWQLASPCQIHTPSASPSGAASSVVSSTGGNRTCSLLKDLSISGCYWTPFKKRCILQTLGSAGSGVLLFGPCLSIVPRPGYGISSLATCTSLEHFLVHGHLRIRPLQWQLKSLWSFLEVNKDVCIPLTPACRV